MNLSEYICTERGNAARLASALGVSISYVSQLSNNYRPVSPARATQIESLTNGSVTRRDLRPNDWHEIWPELAQDSKPQLSTPSEHPTTSTGVNK